MVNYEEISKFPDNSTLRSVHQVARLAGRVRRELSPPHPHWWQVSLSVTESGLTTGAIPGIGEGERTPFRLELDMVRQQLVLLDDRSVSAEWPLRGLRLRGVRDELRAEIADRGHTIALDQDEFDDSSEHALDLEDAGKILKTLRSADGAFKSFRESVAGERGPVHLWPHHFDLAFIRFTGRLAPNVDPADLDSSREQVNHGFVFGDDIIPEPYFYIIPYPMPDTLPETKLSEATLQKDGFTGYVLPWNSMARSSDPESLLFRFLDETTRNLKEVMEG